MIVLASKGIFLNKRLGERGEEELGLGYDRFPFFSIYQSRSSLSPLIALYHREVRQGFALTSRNFGPHGSCMDARLFAYTDVLTVFQKRKIEVHIAVRAGC